MGDSQRTRVEELALDFRFFLRSPTTLGGSYKATTGKNCFSYQVGAYVVEGEFLNEDRCKVKIVNGTSIEDIIDLSYIHPTEPDWLKFFTETCTLINKFQDN